LEGLLQRVNSYEQHWVTDDSICFVRILLFVKETPTRPRSQGHEYVFYSMNFSEFFRFFCTPYGQNAAPDQARALVHRMDRMQRPTRLVRLYTVWTECSTRPGSCACTPYGQNAAPDQARALVHRMDRMQRPIQLVRLYTTKPHEIPTTMFVYIHAMVLR
jgi:hypothetical protein